MNKTYCLLFIAFLVLFPGLLNVLSGPVGTVETGHTNILDAAETVELVEHDYGGQHFIYYTTYSNLLKMPRWDFKRTEPPLPVSSAISIAVKYGRVLAPNSNFFEPLKVGINPSFRLYSVWYYDIQLMPSPPRGTKFFAGSMAPIDVVVLMDGNVADRVEVVADSSGKRLVPVNK